MISTIILPRTTGDVQNNKFNIKCSAKWQMEIIKRSAFNNNWWLHNLYQCGSIIRSTDKLTKTVFQYVNFYGIWQITAHIWSELYKVYDVNKMITIERIMLPQNYCCCLFSKTGPSAKLTSWVSVPFCAALYCVSNALVPISDVHGIKKQKRTKH